ncbi:hypothetical protein EMGBS3_09910 [Anaerolineaceae bacterium]|nr:hypothetical protein EMGBS3_09910 [Anaerolineaceae bacterium]
MGSCLHAGSCPCLGLPSFRGHKTLIDNTWYQRPPGVPQHIAAGGVVARRAGAQVLIALAREKHGADYVLPKGHVEDGEQLEAAARREIMEETGLQDLQLLESLGSAERLDFSRKAWKITHYFLYLTAETDGVPTDAAHHSGVWWFALHALPQLFWPEQQALLADNIARIEAAVLRAA